MSDAEQAPGNTHSPSRRRALKSLGVAAGAWAVGPALSDAGTAAFLQTARVGGASRLTVLTPAEYAAVDVLTDTIIPTDAASPGAHAARVAGHVDPLLGESPAETRSAWRAMDHLKDEMQKGNVWRPRARGAYYRGERA